MAKTAVANEKMDELKEYMGQFKGKPRSESNLITIMHKAQELYGYLSQEAMDAIALEMSIPTAHIWGVATFYHYFNLTEQGKYTISVCLGTACYIKGAAEILDKIREELGIDIGQVTEDKLFGLQIARCLGACGLAPVIMINGKIYGSLTPKKVSEIIQSYRKQAAK
ncbi:MAG: NAD(P)H-dependent oxidoreductase subunit E [Candidatus Omnitrophica bacterium]|nr:NAD(P)H-dependent oxidoreductase subunit E [Candidatus Omnitrophota bacterium]